MIRHFHSSSADGRGAVSGSATARSDVTLTEVAGGVNG
jgi:hypothetical protein